MYGMSNTIYLETMMIP